MKEEQDDLTLVYMFGYKNGKDSMKVENKRLPQPHGKVYCADGHEEAVLIARAAIEGEKKDV